MADPTLESILEPLNPDTLPRRVRLTKQARATMLAGLVLVILGLMVGAALPPGPGTPVMIIGAAVGGTILLIGLLMLAFGASWQSAVNAMVAGVYYIYWTYDQDQWREHVTRAHRASRLVPWVMAGCLTEGGPWPVVAVDVGTARTDEYVADFLKKLRVSPPAKHGNEHTHTHAQRCEGAAEDGPGQHR